MRRDGRPVPRLFVTAPLAQDGAAALSGDQNHYLSRVMRLKQGSALRLFNGRDGEWLAELTVEGARCNELLRPQSTGGEAWLLFAPPKKDRVRFLVEKATELGVARLMPVTTEHTEPPETRRDKLNDWAIEASEQCGRLDVPECLAQESLAATLETWPADRLLLFCDEAGGAPLLQVLEGAAGAVAFLVGPEGGFSPAERDALVSDPRVAPVSLGPHILRVETAAIAALSSWQALRTGDRLSGAAHRALPA